MIEIEYTLTKEEYLQSCQETSIKSFKSWQRWLNQWIDVAILASGLLSIWRGLNPGLFTLESKDTVEDMIFSGCFSIAIGLFLLLRNFPQLNLFHTRFINRTWKKIPALQESRKVEATETGLTLRSQSFSDFRKWEAYTRFAETKNFFLVYYAPKLCHPVLKRSFTNVEEIDRFREILKDKIQARSKS